MRNESSPVNNNRMIWLVSKIHEEENYNNRKDEIFIF